MSGGDGLLGGVELFSELGEVASLGHLNHMVDFLDDGGNSPGGISGLPCSIGAPDRGRRF